MPRNPVVRDLERAFQQGEVSAAFILGRLYDEGWGVRQNATLATKWYLTAAKNGASHAYYFAGSRHMFGDGIRANARAGYRWFERAAALGDLDAKYMIATCMIDGRGTAQDPKRGLAMVRRVAGEGSSAAMDFLAAHFLERRRLKTARHWALRAVRAGDSLAQLRLDEIDRLLIGQANLRLHPTPPRRSRAASRRG